MRRDQGLAVHQSDCSNAQRARRADPERWLDLQWGEDSGGLYAANLDLTALNERGVLGRIAIAISEAESNILNVHVEDDGSNIAQIHFRIQVRDRQHLARIVRSLRRIKQVSKVSRSRANARAGDEPPGTQG
jgi:GTP pyrophosphokinase